MEEAVTDPNVALLIIGMANEYQGGREMSKYYPAEARTHFPVLPTVMQAQLITPTDHCEQDTGESITASINRNVAEGLMV
jgi:hypothetical protein